MKHFECFMCNSKFLERWEIAKHMRSAHDIPNSNSEADSTKHVENLFDKKHQLLLEPSSYFLSPKTFVTTHENTILKFFDKNKRDHLLQDQLLAKNHPQTLKTRPIMTKPMKMGKVLHYSRICHPDFVICTHRIYLIQILNSIMPLVSCALF